MYISGVRTPCTTRRNEGVYPENQPHVLHPRFKSYHPSQCRSSSLSFPPHLVHHHRQAEYVGLEARFTTGGVHFRSHPHLGPHLREAARRMAGRR